MATIDILYITLIVAIVVITVTVVWLSNDLRGLIRSLRRSAEDTEKVTHEIREKVLMVSEALDRAGAAASSIIGMIENAIEEIKDKRDAIVSSIGLLSGAGRAIKERRSQKDEEPDEVEEEVEMPVKKETKLAKESKKDDSKPSVDSVAKPVEKKKEEPKKELKKAPTSETVGVPTESVGKKIRNPDEKESDEGSEDEEKPKEEPEGKEEETDL